jgi:hypothetical protein
MDRAPLVAPRAGAARAPIAAASSALDPDSAALEILATIATTEPALVLLFASPSRNLAQIARRLRGAELPQCTVIGCTTAGELCSLGYRRDTVVAISFPRSTFRARAVLLRDLSRLDVSDWMAQIRTLLEGFQPDNNRHVIGLVLIDGLSNQEDVLIAALDAALARFPVFGGSAGAGLDFRHADVLLDDALASDAAVFCLIESDLEVQHIVIDHFRSDGPDMVVTAAKSEQRLVREINAEPAAEEYARLVGVAPQELSPFIFAEHPLIVQINGRNYVRAIRAQTEDGSLQLMSAVETGTVLQIGHADHLVEGFEHALSALPAPPLLTLSFDCILRRLAAERAGLTDEIARLFGRYNVAGFSTYGEQHGGIHVNQTFVGLAFMPEKSLDEPRG